MNVANKTVVTFVLKTPLYCESYEDTPVGFTLIKHSCSLFWEYEVEVIANAQNTMRFGVVYCI